MNTQNSSPVEENGPNPEWAPMSDGAPDIKVHEKLARGDKGGGDLRPMWALLEKVARNPLNKRRSILQRQKIWGGGRRRDRTGEGKGSLTSTSANLSSSSPWSGMGTFPGGGCSSPGPPPGSPLSVFPMPGPGGSRGGGGGSALLG